MKMFDCRRLLAIAVAFILLPAPGAAQAVSPADAKPAAPTQIVQSAAKRLSELGPEGRAIAKLAGMWDVTLTNFPRSGGAPVVRSDLVAERRMIGPMLQEIIRSVPGAPSFERVDDLLFNRLENRWDYVSMDSGVPDGLMVAWSLDTDPVERIRVSFLPFATAGNGPEATGQMFRMEQIIIRQDANHDVKDQYFTPAGATKWLAKRYTYTRRT